MNLSNGDSTQGAEDIYEEFLRKKAEGDPRGIDDLCREYPQVSGTLRALHSMRENPSPSGTTEDFKLEGLTSGSSSTEGPSSAVGPSRCREDYQKGDLVGRYTILGPAKKGGFSSVYPAEQARPKRTDALKVIQPAKASPEVLARFRQEQGALALMSHPSIAQVFEAGETAEGEPFVAMEFVSGPPITIFCDLKKFDLR